MLAALLHHLAEVVGARLEGLQADETGVDDQSVLSPQAQHLRRQPLDYGAKANEGGIDIGEEAGLHVRFVEEHAVFVAHVSMAPL